MERTTGGREQGAKLSAASGKEVTSVLGNRVFIRPGNCFVEFSVAEVEQSIPSRFELIVAKYPSHLAVKQNDLEVSYDALNDRSDQAFDFVF